MNIFEGIINLREPAKWYKINCTICGVSRMISSELVYEPNKPYFKALGFTPVDLKKCYKCGTENAQKA